VSVEKVTVIASGVVAEWYKGEILAVLCWITVLGSLQIMMGQHPSRVRQAHGIPERLNFTRCRPS